MKIALNNYILCKIELSQCEIEKSHDSYNQIPKGHSHDNWAGP